MGKIQIITKAQKVLLDQITNNEYIARKFYLTGGTTLSLFYLQHRYSDDLDFFSEEEIEQDAIFALMSSFGKKIGFRFTSRFVEVVYRFSVSFKNKNYLKVDFGFYPYHRIKQGGKHNLMQIDSLRDIATNKLITLNQRTDVKDFVDLYFLLSEYFSVWDLLYSAEVKFKQLDIDILLLAEDFLKVEDFTSLPKMIKPLTLTELKKFFRQKAKEVGKKAVE